jgi:hypothetical protein
LECIGRVVLATLIERDQSMQYISQEGIKHPLTGFEVDGLSSENCVIAAIACSFQKLVYRIP